MGSLYIARNGRSYWGERAEDQREIDDDNARSDAAIEDEELRWS